MKTPSFPTLAVVISGLVILIGLLFWAASSNPANLPLWADSAFLGGSLFIIAGGASLILFIWPYINGTGRVAAFILACFGVIVMTSEIGTAIELGFNDYTWFSIPNEPNKATETVVVIMTLVAIYFSTIGQKRIQHLEF